MRILIIEDSPDIADVVATKLSKEGYGIVCASNGEDGEELALTDSFDLVILDINLPRRDGFLVLAAMRAAGQSTPVLVLTARNQIADKVSLLDLGADDYIVKPFDLSELAARVRALSRRRMGVAQPHVHVGTLAIDLFTRAAMIAGNPLDLGRREFEVLVLLATSAGTTLSKEHLVLKLFGHDDVGTPNAVELLVSRVRRKLEGSDVEIVTQRSVGYLLRLKQGEVAPHGT